MLRQLQVAASRAFSSMAPLETTTTVLRLHQLSDNPGASKQARRIGRGIGSSKGKTSGRGHKGQKSRSGGGVPLTFEGGQTKQYKLFPKRGFNNKRHETPMLPINLSSIQNMIDMGRLDPSQTIGLREMQLAGLFKANTVKGGVKLLGDGTLRQAVDLQVSRASKSAVQAVEAAGGTVQSVHYNALALRALLRPHKYGDAPPAQARPPPKFQSYYTRWENRGYLHPAVQMREWLQTQDASVQEQWEAMHRPQEETNE